MLAAGSLNQRITLEQPSTGQDAAGQPVTGWEIVATLWASIRTLSGSETIKAGADTSVIKASIRIRQRAGITSAMRITHGSGVYQIKAVPPVVARRDFMDLVCEVAS